MSRRTLVVLGIVAAACLVILICVFATAQYRTLGDDVERIWRNTLESGANAAATDVPQRQ